MINTIFNNIFSLTDFNLLEFLALALLVAIILGILYTIDI
jgi:hypothetical protein